MSAFAGMKDNNRTPQNVAMYISEIAGNTMPCSLPSLPSRIDRVLPASDL